MARNWSCEHDGCGESGIASNSHDVNIMTERTPPEIAGVEANSTSG